MDVIEALKQQIGQSEFKPNFVITDTHILIQGDSEKSMKEAIEVMSKYTFKTVSMGIWAGPGYHWKMKIER